MPVVFFIVVSFRIAGGGYEPDGKNHNRCVIHHVSGGNGLLVPAVAGQGFPSQWAAIGVLGSLLFGLLTYLTNLYFKSERTGVRRHGESKLMSRKLRYGLSAAVLALIAAGASAPEILDQFLDEKEGNHTTAYRDGAGIWTICRGAIMVDGKPVIPGMKLSKENATGLTLSNGIRRWHGWSVI